MFWNTSRTTYAGKMKCRIGPFRTKGEHWFAVQCVDSHGVESIMQFFDFLVQDRAEETPEVYQASVQFLRNKGIVFSKEEPEAIVAVRNKYNLSKLMASLAAVDSNGHRYNTLRIMANPETDGYLWLDYHKPILEDNEVVGVRKAKYYVRRIDLVNGTRVYTDTEIKPGAVISIIRPGAEAGTFVTTDYTVPSDIKHPLAWVKQDGCHFYRDANNKIRVHYASTEAAAYIDKTTEVWVGESDTELFTKRQYVYLWNDSIATNTINCSMDKLASGDGETYGYCYYTDIKSTENISDSVDFPNNFTLDLNNNIVKCIHDIYDCFGYDNSYGSRIPTGLFTPKSNINTHVKNGTVIGPYDESKYDFKLAFLAAGVAKITPSEAMGNIGFVASKYCSFVSVNSERALCYDGRTIVPNGDGGHSFVTSGIMGYYNYDGILITDADRVALYNVGDGWGYNQVSGNSPMVTLATCSVSDSIPENQPDLWITPLTAKEYFRIGKQHEFFIQFLDENNRHLKLVKTASYHMVKKYPGTKFIRIIGYSVSVDNNGTRELVLNGVLPFAMNSMGVFYSRYFCKNIKFLDCHWRYTRSCAITGQSARGMLYDRCTWSDIAVHRGFGSVTPYLADLEEGSYFRDCVTFRKCYARVGDTGLGKLQFIVDSCRNLKFVKNSMAFYGDWPCENGWFEDNEFYGGLRIRTNAEFERQMYVFKNCFCSYLSASFTYIDGFYSNGRQGKNLSEDPVTGKVFDKISFSDCFFLLGTGSDASGDSGKPEVYMNSRTLSPRNTCFTSTTNSTDRYKFYID